MYREAIIERYKFPRRKGVLQKADAQAEVVNSLCGDEIVLYMKLDEGRVQVADARFDGQGCALTLASADLLCENVIGKSLTELQKITADYVLALYGEMPSPSRLKCVLLPYEALKMSLQLIRIKKQEL